MAIEPISHNVLVQMIRYRIRQTGLTMMGISSRTQIPVPELVDLLEGRIMASPSHLARLALVFEMDWAKIAAGYGYWLFEIERIKASKIMFPGGEKSGTIFRNLEVCSAIIRENPHLDADTLADVIRDKLLLDPGAIRNQIAHIRSQPGGSYNYG